MRSVLSWLSRRWLAFALPLLAACAAGAPGVMGTTDNRALEGAGAPHVAFAEPLVREGVVDGTFLLDGPGYAMVVAVDLDGLVRVVYPERPIANRLLLANQSQRITPFLAGHGRGSARSAYWDREYPYSFGHPFYRPTLASFQPGVSRSRGAVYLVAIASARPLELDRLRAPDGEWDGQLLRSVVFDADPSFVGARLGQLVVPANQQFTTDYRVIVDGRDSPLYVGSAYGLCGRSLYGYGSDAVYYGSPMLGSDPYLSNSALFVTGVAYPSVGPYAGRGLCRPSFIWTEQPEQIRRPSPLFPNDTSLLFTTRRLAARRPGAHGGGAGSIIPAIGGDVRNNGPQLSRGTTEGRPAESPVPRTATPAAHSEAPARADAPVRGDATPRGEAHGNGEHAPASASARSGQRY